MKQYTNTQRVTITSEMKAQLEALKQKYSIRPTAFIRQAIAEKLAREIPALKTRSERIKTPF